MNRVGLVQRGCTQRILDQADAQDETDDEQNNARHSNDGPHHSDLRLREARDRSFLSYGSVLGLGKTKARMVQHTPSGLPSDVLAAPGNHITVSFGPILY